MIGGVTVFTPLLDLYGREAAAYVQSFGLKAVAVVSLRLINSRSPERASLETFFVQSAGRLREMTMTDFSNFETIKSDVNRKIATLESRRKAYLCMFVFFSAGLLFTETALRGGWSPMVPITAVGAVFGMLMNIKTGDRISSLKREMEQLQNGYEQKDERRYFHAAEMVGYLTKDKMAATLLLCSVTLALTACAAGGPVYTSQVLTPPSKGKAQLLVYRTSSFVASVSKTSVEVNGMSACDLPNSSFFKFEIDPGQTTVAASIWGAPGTSRLTFATKAGARYFVKIAPNSNKIFAASTAGLLSMGAAEAMSEDRGPFIIRLTDKENAVREIATTNQSTNCQ